MVAAMSDPVEPRALGPAFWVRAAGMGGMYAVGALTGPCSSAWEGTGALRAPPGGVSEVIRVCDGVGPALWGESGAPWGESGAALCGLDMLCGPDTPRGVLREPPGGVGVG
jgi:hypothetical protein